MTLLGTGDVPARSGVDQTRLRILAATRELYADRGSRGTTTREVADRAGVNEATLFRHFGTKGQLLDAMLVHYSSVEDTVGLLNYVRSLGSLDEQLVALGHGAIESIRRKEDLIRVSMGEVLANPEHQACAWRAPSEARQRLERFFEEKVAAGELRGEAGMLTRAFMSFFFSYVIARQLWGDCEHSIDSAVELIVGLFLNGARA